MIERVCVVGAGAIGSLYAAHLAGVASVAVLTRRKEQAHALATEGLRISGKQDFTALVEASDDPAELADADLVIVATKATQLEEAAAQLAGRSPGAVVMTVQNGLGAEEVVRRHGDWPLISAVTFMSGVRRSDTHVEYELDTPTWMGPYAGTHTRLELVEEVHELLVDSGLRGEVFADLLPAQWSKLIFNASVNTVAAVTGLPHVALFAREEEPTDLGHLVHGLVDEGKRVAAAAGVEPLRGSLGDEPARGGTGRDREVGLRPRAVHARGRPRAPAHGGRRDHGRAGTRGRAPRRADAAPLRHVPAREGQGGVVVTRRRR